MYSRETMNVGTFPGSLSEASFVAFTYDARDVLCLEKLELVPTGEDAQEKRIIQDFLSWSWDVSQGRQSWTPKVFFVSFPLLTA